jgi:hypothetical protein
MTDLEKKESKRKSDKKYRENNKEYLKEYDRNRDKSKIRTRCQIYYQNNKEIKKEKAKKYRLNNKEKIKKWEIKYCENNVDKLKIRKKNYYENNKEKIKIYRKNNKDKIKQYNNVYIKNRRKTDPLFKLRCNIRNLITLSLIKQGYNKQSRTFEILGCSFEDFKQHLERQFKKGMTWENQGQWHLDHIYPVSLAKDEQELIRLNHYTNFQPMWALENIIKGNKIIPNTQIKLI